MDASVAFAASILSHAAAVLHLEGLQADADLRRDGSLVTRDEREETERRQRFA